MKITMQSTSLMVEASGIQCRVWEGETEKGVKVQVLVPRIAVKKGQDMAQFEAELTEHAAPSVDAMQVFPLRMIL